MDDYANLSLRQGIGGVVPNFDNSHNIETSMTGNVGMTQNLFVSADIYI